MTGGMTGWLDTQQFHSSTHRGTSSQAGPTAEHTLETTMSTSTASAPPHPTDRLYVENGSGTVRVTAHDTERGHGRHHRPRRRRRDRDRGQRATRSAWWRRSAGPASSRATPPCTCAITVPADQRADGQDRVSADVTVDGTVGASQVKSGSGEVTLAEARRGRPRSRPARATSTVEVAHAELRVKSGSGDVAGRPRDVRASPCPPARATSGSGPARAGRGQDRLRRPAGRRRRRRRLALDRLGRPARRNRPAAAGSP